MSGSMKCITCGVEAGYMPHEGFLMNGCISAFFQYYFWTNEGVQHVDVPPSFMCTDCLEGLRDLRWAPRGVKGQTCEAEPIA